MKHKVELEKKLNEIQAMLDAINLLVTHCHGDNRPDCPILEDLQCHKVRGKTV